MNNSGKEKKKKSPGTIIAVIIILVSFLSEAADDTDGMVGFIVMLAVIVLIFWFIIRAAKKSIKKGAEDRYGEHSHDRITVSSKEIRECDGLEHWKVQLDGFMKAGLIERDEYNVLLNRYKQEMKNENK